MKKIIVLMLALLLVPAFSTPVLAIDLPTQNPLKMTLSRPTQEKIDKARENDLETIEVLTDNIDGSGDFAVAAHFCLRMGLRRGELLGLRWSDIDLQKKYISVTQSASRQKPSFGEKSSMEIGKLKNDSSYRIVPIPNKLIPLLKKHQIKQIKEKVKAGSLYENNDLVFNNNKGKPAEVSRFYRTVQAIGEKAGIEGVHPHVLRHTYATRLSEAGTNPKWIQLLLGHSSIKMQEVYTHATIETLINVVQLAEKNDFPSKGKPKTNIHIYQREHHLSLVKLPI